MRSYRSSPLRAAPPRSIGSAPTLWRAADRRPADVGHDDEDEASCRALRARLRAAGARSERAPTSLRARVAAVFAAWWNEP